MALSTGRQRHSDAMFTECLALSKLIRSDNTEMYYAQRGPLPILQGSAERLKSQFWRSETDWKANEQDDRR